MIHVLLVSLALALAQEPPKPPQPPAPPAKPAEQPPIALKVEKLQRLGPDGVTLTADHHSLPFDESSRPLFVCFHMENGSRAEFAKIAPKLAEYACPTLAIDLRNGKATDGVANETATSAAAVLKKTEFTNEEAFADVVEGLKWAREMHPSGKLFALGSGTSAALVIAAVARTPELADVLFLFSPAEDVPGWSIAMEAKKLTVPVYVTCGASPQEGGRARLIGNSIDKKLRTMVIPTNVPGATRGSTLLVQTERELSDRHWMGVIKMILDLAPLDAPAAGAPPKQG